MNNKMLERWKLKTKGIFHKIVYDEFWLYIDNLMKENKKLQQENERLKKDVELFKSYLISCTNTGLSLITKIDKAIEKLGNYKHYSTPTEEQNSENENIVDSAINILQNGSETSE